MSRLYPELPIPGVAAVTVRGRMVLLAERGKPPSLGKWGIPGGVVEVGETREEAVVREVLEETNVMVKPVELLDIIDSISRDDEGIVRHHYILFEYLCEYVSGEVIPGTDAPDARWVSIDDLGSVNIMTYTRRFIERILTDRGMY